MIKSKDSVRSSSYKIIAEKYYQVAEVTGTTFTYAMEVCAVEA